MSPFDLDGRGAGAYRCELPRCPSCGDALEATAAGAAEVDVCPRCGGVWIDWTDGDLTSLARAATRASVVSAVALGSTQAGDGACPRCRATLGVDQVGVVTIARCGTCVGAFVTRAALEDLARSLPADDRPISHSLIERLAFWFESVLDGRAPSPSSSKAGT